MTGPAKPPAPTPDSLPRDDRPDPDAAREADEATEANEALKKRREGGGDRREAGIDRGRVRLPPD